MDNDPRGTIVRQGELMRANNALVEEAVCFGATSGYIVISYAMPGTGQTVFIQTVRLNINRNTRILNSFGQNVGLCSIQKGMFINAVFSSRMTRSIPPQSTAFLIVVQRRPQESANVTTDRIAFVDTQNNSIYTGNPNDINDQTRFIVTNNTTITDRSGRPIRLGALRPGQLVRITHANFQTASIPPQTTAFRIQRL